MGKKSSKPATTQTVTSTPYLTSDVNYAAAQAKNLYQGFTPQMSQLYSQIGDLNRQISEASQANRAGQGPINISGIQYPNYESVPAKLRAGLTTYDPSYINDLTSKRDALQTQLNGLSPNLPQFFPGNTYVDYSPETMQGLDAISQRATAGSPLTAGAGKAFLDTVNGVYMNGNPYIDDVINRSLDEVTKKYSNNVLPGLASNFAQSGRYGSGIQGQLTADAIGNLGKEAMSVASGIRYDNYNNERARQMTAAALAPQLAQSDYYDAQQLLGVGNAREALSQAKLQDEMDRFNFYQNQPSILLDQYISRIGSLNGSSKIETTTGPVAQRPGSGIGGAISGGLGGLGLASQLAKSGAFGAGILGSTPGMAAIGGPWGLGLAAGGALLGGLFG